MNIVKVHKADPTGDQVIEPGVIDISEKLPAFVGKEWVTEAKELYRADAIKIADALEVLPGGTRHELICELLGRHQMLFRVRL